ncbi:ACT domain-containing protein [Maribacter confluentis]|uniref:ACT domain-containing protein n=1 Tax=Maribacter confluentis TaxID=1656093 RepID=A0ABT8RQL0_9FLAO|nr:ACT domain-containing protein [Maribacter confluentis]MDO1512908.1 ACT domain-containing protein [Maribacter confluentis]
MAGEKDLNSLLKGLHPKLNPGTYVFITTKAPLDVDRSHIIFEFKEFEGVTHIISKEKAEELELEYAFVSSWITLNVHSSLEAIGLTAAIAGALTKNNISCNVVAAFYHDHLFVPENKTRLAMDVLEKITEHL